MSFTESTGAPGRFSGRCAALRLALCAAACSLAAACERSPAPTDAGATLPATQVSRETTPSAALPQPTIDVVIYLIDTLRADRLGVYGYDRPTSPQIDALARESVLFEQACAPAPWTLPSIASILTSTFLCEHGVISEGYKVDPGVVTLAERFRSVGYRTVSLYVNDFAGPVSGLDRGYDVCTKLPAYVEAADIAPHLRDAARPLLLYVHNIEPHNPFNAAYEHIRLFGSVPDFQVERMSRLLSYYRRFLRLNWPATRRPGAPDNSPQQQALLTQLHALLKEHNVLYDAVVREADQRLGEVVGELKRSGRWENTLFVLLSDHGEELGEHGAYLHSQSLYQELLRVPLLIRFPRDEHAGRRVRDVVSLVDVLPTLLDAVGRPDLAGQARGRSLMPLIRGQAREGDSPFVIPALRENVKKHFQPWADSRGDRNLAILSRDGRWKGIWNIDLNTFELYDLAADPREQTNVAETNEPMLQAMFAAARPWLEQCLAGRKTGEQVPLEHIDEQTLRNLAALGYVDLPESQPASDPESP